MVDSNIASITVVPADKYLTEYLLDLGRRSRALRHLRSPMLNYNNKVYILLLVQDFNNFDLWDIAEISFNTQKLLRREMNYETGTLTWQTKDCQVKVETIVGLVELNDNLVQFYFKGI